MSTSEPANEIEIVASVTQSQSQMLLEPAIENPDEQSSPIPDLDTSDSNTGQRNSLSSSETSGMFYDYYYASIQNLMLFPVNFPSPKKQGQTTANSERPLEVPTASIEDEYQLQGVIGVSQGGHLEGTTTSQRPHQCPEIPAPESIPAVVPKTEAGVTTSEPSSTLGAPVKIAAISISEHEVPQEPLPASNVSTHEDTVSYQSPPLGITGQSYGIANTFPLVETVGTGKKSSGKGLLKGM